MEAAQGSIPAALASWLREELLSQGRLRGGSSDRGDRSGGSSFSSCRRDCFLFRELLNTHTHIRTYTRAHTHTHRDRKEVRLFVYLCRGTECYVFTLFCVVSVLYVGYSWYASLSVARPGTVNFAPKTQSKCKGPEALMWGFLLPLKIK